LETFFLPVFLMLRWRILYLYLSENQTDLSQYGLSRLLSLQYASVDWRKMMWMLKDIGVEWRNRNLIAKLYLGQRAVIKSEWIRKVEYA